MEDEREGRGGKVRVLIEKATDSTEPELDPRVLNAIKSVVRKSDSELRIAAYTLMDLMKREHSQVRYLTLLIIDELFMRSKLFRSLLVVNMEKLLSLSVGFRRNQPLPAPAAIASQLRSKAIEFLEKWNDSFGVHYRQLRLGFDYLKNTLRFQFPNLQANAARLQQERRERERKSKEILLNKYETFKENFPSTKDEIHSTISEIGECLGIVHSREEQTTLVPLDEEDFEEFRSSELWQIRLSTLEEAEKVHENSDNKVVFDALRELYKLVTTKHLVSVQEWISVLVRVDLTDSKFRDSALKELIDIKNRLQSVKKKCEEAGFALQNNGNNDNEDFWEEGVISSTDSRSSSRHEANEDHATTSQSNEVKNTGSAFSSKAPGDMKMRGSEGGQTQSNSLKSKLLAEAPVVTWGSHLDNWGSKRDVLANQRGLELEGHWGRVDYDAVIPAEKIAELNVQATVYKEDRAEIQPCRAPLSKGGFCQRRDLRVCPFHGPIIPRDNDGKPIDQHLSKDETNSNAGNKLAEKLARQAVKNLRERDKEVTRKAQMDKQELQRAKRAKIREHNEAVLKDAALASTSKSAAIGEDTNVKNPFARNKKQTLSSMLRKKVTTKDRLSLRLLNTRASEATVIQLTLGEDANYREAFPNQW